MLRQPLQLGNAFHRRRTHGTDDCDAAYVSAEDPWSTIVGLMDCGHDQGRECEPLAALKSAIGEQKAAPLRVPVSKPRIERYLRTVSFLGGLRSLQARYARQDRMSEMPNLRKLASTPPYPEFLHAFCRKISFDPGDIVRRQDQYYKELYLVTEGSLDVLSPSPAREARTSIGPGSMIGEIGLLQGSRATAAIVARTAASALVIDYETLWKIHEGDRRTAVQFCRYLAKVSQPNDNKANLMSLLPSSSKASDVDVSICNNDDQVLQEAMRLRYNVCCVEYGRDSPDADHAKRILTDRLDGFGHMFVAVKAGEVIGTLRTNLSREGSLGIFEELYGMTSSKHHPAHTAICGRFTVKKLHRGTPVFLKLCTVFLDYMIKQDILECYVGCEPHLAAIYTTLGFRQAAERFFHYDFGPNDPMVLDLARHGKRLRGLAGI
jgi:CRP-like cAMP-binding protein